MNWIKYFLSTLFAGFLSILIIINNEKVSIDNKKISSYTKTQNFLLGVLPGKPINPVIRNF